jgi:flagellar FliL protein
MAKDKVNPSEDEEDAKADAGENAEPKKGFVKKLLGNRKMLMIAGGGALALVLAAGGGAYFLFFSGSDAQSEQAKMAGAKPLVPIVPPQVSFFNMPDIVVNIQTADGAPAYLKLSVALELAADDEKPGLQVLMPRIVDEFQSYLRELRVDDLRGSEGVLRLKEELLRRINVAANPYRVRDVLLKQMIVQ